MNLLRELGLVNALFHKTILRCAVLRNEKNVFLLEAVIRMLEQEVMEFEYGLLKA
jgi:hypothetical protein